MTKKISKSEKQETKIESLQDENERLKRAMVLKIIFGVLGFLVVLVATYFGVKNSPANFAGVTFETNALHLFAAFLVGLPWVSDVFKKR